MAKMAWLRLTLPRTALLLAYGLLGSVTLAATLVPVPLTLQMLVTTCTLIYIGSHYSACAQERVMHGDVVEEIERMETKDALMFPVIGSCVLFSMYLVFRYIDREYVDLAVSTYFTVFGTTVLGMSFESLFFLIMTPKAAKDWKHPLNAELFRIRIPYVSPDEVTEKMIEDNCDDESLVLHDGKSGFTLVMIISYTTSALLVGNWAVTRHWIINNLIASAFAIQGIHFLSLGSFLNGAILLCGLFFYDIFWVFGTDVMVTVAKNFDGPIKLLYPRSTDGSVPPSLLGLGDIVIPGVFIALLLRFDFHRRRLDGGGSSKGNVSKVYFGAVFVGYAIGLVVTLVSMFVFNAAQPALLYLVPACLISSLGTAAYRGELKMLTKFDEEFYGKERPEKEEAEPEKEKAGEGAEEASAGETKKDK